MWLAYQSTGVIYGDIGMLLVPFLRNHTGLHFISRHKSLICLLFHFYKSPFIRRSRGRTIYNNLDPHTYGFGQICFHRIVRG